MKLKALGIGAVLAAVVLTDPVGFAQQGAAPAKPATCPAEGFSGGFTRGCPQKQFANLSGSAAMMAALPDKPYATPQSLRRVLVLGRAVGWVHTSIPLAAKMVEYLGDKTGAWMTTITYDAAAISGGFTRGCPQKQFTSPADISAMMAALPDKPYATPQSLSRVLVLGRAEIGRASCRERV